MARGCALALLLVCAPLAATLTLRAGARTLLAASLLGTTARTIYRREAEWAEAEKEE